MIDERRLQNWGRWLRRGYAPATAMSVEGDYRTPRDEARREPRPADPIATDAWDIEIACRLLPVRRHVLLKLLYVNCLSGPAILKAYRIHFKRRLTLQELDAEEYVAKVELTERLQLPAVVRMDRAQAMARRVLAALDDPVRDGS